MKCKKQLSGEEERESNPILKVAERNELFEQLYEDVIENIRESEKIKSFATSNYSNNPEWLKLQTINEEQRVKLKEILHFFMMNQEKSARKRKDEDKENQARKSYFTTDRKDEQRASYQSLTSSKSRRRRSHNKFEVVKRVNSVEKEKHQIE